MPNTTPTKDKIKRRLVSREHAGEMLGGVKLQTLKELEGQDLLTPIRLTGAITAKVYYDLEELEELIAQRIEEAKARTRVLRRRLEQEVDERPTRIRERPARRVEERAQRSSRTRPDLEEVE